jgi:hypothetical protein
MSPIVSPKIKKALKVNTDKALKFKKYPGWEKLLWSTIYQYAKR